MVEPSIEALLARFTADYLNSIEASLDSLGRERFGEHGEKVTSAIMLKCSDGWASFYMPPPPLRIANKVPYWPEAGVHVWDFSGHTLDAACETIHLHHLRVMSDEVGQPLRFMREPPPETAGVAEAKGTVLFSFPVREWVHETVGTAKREGRSLENLIVLPALAIARPVYVENGIIARHVPTRVKIWSPTLQLPNGPSCRLFQWTHADFWWQPEQLSIDSAKTPSLALDDLIALSVVGPPAIAADGRMVTAKDPAPDAAAVLEARCDEFLQLLTEHGADESKIHSWLKNHQIFLDPMAKHVWSKLPFGKEVSDFVVQRSDGTYLLVEIEPASFRIFTARYEPRAEFTHAGRQIAGWQRYIRDNVQTVRSELHLESIDLPDGMIVYGRSSEIAGNEEAKRIWRDLKATHACSVYTYDELIDRIRHLADQLRRLPVLGAA